MFYLLYNYLYSIDKTNILFYKVFSFIRLRTVEIAYNWCLSILNHNQNLYSFTVKNRLAFLFWEIFIV